MSDRSTMPGIMLIHQGHRNQHGCFSATAIIGICYLTKYQLSCLKGTIKTKKCKTAKSTVTCRSRTYNYAIQLLQSYECIYYVPAMITVAAVVCT